MSQNVSSAAVVIGVLHITNHAKPGSILPPNVNCLQVLSADNLCKQFAKCRASFGSKLFDTLKVFLKEYFEKDDFISRGSFTKLGQIFFIS